MTLRYAPGNCEGCGRHRPTAVIAVSGIVHRLCAKCIRPYRRVLIRETRRPTEQGSMYQ